ncbi:MAG: R body protein RebB-like protein [Okeania sp. SIO3I5]|uniref:RebB family R body protein n=1 Tax=Okeania sp. SIO3I5 TaxID=2607805 RepID=UPI0013BD5B97|nr:RebB family R body protein [Okeania sp. SIO3I5]NEQ40440.1 R body protein RebB-like protein [Okeania sp. SIO3I5]
MPDNVNGAITDAVTQANVKVLADSPALSLSNLYQTVSQSLSLSVQNAVTMQQQSNIVQQATTTQGVNLLYTVGTAALTMATGKIRKTGISDNLVKLLGSVGTLKKSRTRRKKKVRVKGKKKVRVKGKKKVVFPPNPPKT